MTMSSAYVETLERLNRGALQRTFTPQTDIDWTAETTDDEFAALYPAWSLFAGTGADDSLSSADRIAFAKYQQMNLMLFTAVLERHALGSMAMLYDADRSLAFQDCLGHFIKEETYHYMMFMRAIARIHASMPGKPPLPSFGVDRILRVIFAAVSLVPWPRLRTSVTVTLFRFAEQVTMFANQVAHSRIERRDSLVNRVWGYHALDEARHLAFDDLVLEHHGLRRRWRWLTGALAAPLCILMSLMLNRNELWAARQLGLRIPLWRLPSLMRRTQATFKRRVFALLGQTLRGTQGSDRSDPANAPAEV